MFTLNHYVINTIVNSVFWADRSSRSDLINGYIVKEDDYTSNFTNNIRQQINSKSIPGLIAHSQVLQKSHEQAYGCDACIIISSENWFKVGLFEAKWPRLLVEKGKYDWDSNSRFTTQLARQSKLLPAIAIWEMFYCEFDYLLQPSNFPNFVSACAKHSNALSHDKTKKIKKWGNNDLNTLLNSSLTTIDQIIREMCLCSFGMPIKGSWKDHIGVLETLAPKHIITIEYSNNAQ